MKTSRMGVPESRHLLHVALCLPSALLRTRSVRSGLLALFVACSHARLRVKRGFNVYQYNDWLRRELDLDIRGTCAWIPRRDGA